MRTHLARLGVVFVTVSLLTVTGSAAAATLNLVSAPAMSSVSVKAELSGWQKTLLSKKQVINLSGLRPNLDLAKNYVDDSTIAKTWTGERDGTGMTSVIVQVGKMPSKGWKASMKGYAKNGGFTIDELNSGTFKAQREGASGTQTYAVTKNAGPFYVLIEYTVPGASADAVKFYGIADRMANVQKQQLNAAGYGR